MKSTSSSVNPQSPQHRVDFVQDGFGLTRVEFIVFDLTSCLVFNSAANRVLAPASTLFGGSFGFDTAAATRPSVSAGGQNQPGMGG
jgi:hypothetical protein